MKIYHSLSSRETQALGERTARSFASARLRAGHREETHTSAKVYPAVGATVVALQGDFGAGKTTFVQGFFKGLGLKKRAQSPTFIIMRRHGIPTPKGLRAGSALQARRFKNVFHIDAYRLKEAAQMKALDFHEIMRSPQNVILIEWPERIKRLLPKNTTWILFEHGKKENERSIGIKARSSRKLMKK